MSPAPVATGSAAAQPKPIQVRVEVISWVNGLSGGPGTGTQVLEEPALEGETIRAVLRRASVRHLKLHQALWDANTGELAEHIEIIVNDVVLGRNHELDSPLIEGDSIGLVGQYIGG